MIIGRELGDISEGDWFPEYKARLYEARRVVLAVEGSLVVIKSDFGRRLSHRLLLYCYNL